MREFVQGISKWAKSNNHDFIIIPQNGHELLTENGEGDGAVSVQYIEAIDGVGREDLFYGYDEDNEATPEDAQTQMLDFMKVAEKNGVQVLVADYCSDRDKIDDSYRKNASYGFISFAAPERDLNVIPAYPRPIYNSNSSDIEKLSEARNLLYLLNPADFGNKNRFLGALRETNYDLIIIDAFFEDEEGNSNWLSPQEIDSLKRKKNGGKRLVISYMSIGEAESYRYYWKAEWNKNGDGKPGRGAPDWLAEENPIWAGNFKVRYWEPEWQAIIYGNSGSYLKKIIELGFVGVYLDIIDAFEYFED